MTGTTTDKPGPQRASDADGQWIRQLHPASTPLRPASRPQTVAEVVAMLGEGPLGWAVELGHVMAKRITGELPVFGGGQEAFETLRMGTESATLRSMMLIVSNDPARLGVTEEALEGDRNFVRRGIPLEHVLRGIRLGHSLMAHGFLEAAATLVEEPRRAAEMKRTSDMLFEYIDDFASSMAAEYLAERDRWVTSAAAERDELVRSILDQRPVSVTRASTVLGYPLGRHHMAIVAWQDPSADRSPIDLQRAASRIFAHLECPATLMVPHGASSLWAWGARRSWFDASQITAHSPALEGIYVAAGTTGQGLTGFRQSHLEAARAAEFARLTAGRADASVTDYNTIELAALLAHDLELARSFVARELGPLAEDTATAAELRETLAAYLGSERSLARAAEQLHVARNTVAYRVKKFENTTGRDLKHRTLELQCALRLATTLGSRILAATESGP
jgi:hypothetical protein